MCARQGEQNKIDRLLLYVLPTIFNIQCLKGQLYTPHHPLPLEGHSYWTCNGPNPGQPSMTSVVWIKWIDSVKKTLSPYS